MPQLRVKLYPFEVKIYRPDEQEALAVHVRHYGQQQDILEPLHYLSLLEQRSGAFEHAKPLRQWRAKWPEVYERLLAEVQQRQPGGAGVRQFIRVLRLYQQYPADLVEQAVTQALQSHCPHLDGWNCVCGSWCSQSRPRPAWMSATIPSCKASASNPFR